MLKPQVFLSCEHWNKYNYGYDDRLPLLSIPIQFYANDSAFLEVTIDIKEQSGVGLYPTSTFSSSEPYVNWNNIPMGFNHIHHHFPDRYYFSFSKPNVSFTLGSGTSTFGTGNTGNLLLSKDTGNIPAIRLSWYNSSFRYTFSYLSLNPGLGNSGAYAHEPDGVRMSLDLASLTSGYNQAIYNDDDIDGNPYDGFMDTGLYPYKGYLMHAMEFRILK